MIVKHQGHPFLLITVGLIAVILNSGCTERSILKSIGSNDWFRRGVDRFYLATVPTTVLQQSSQSIKVGQDLLVGVGCFGEPKDPASLVTTSEQTCSSKKAKIPLNERIRLHDFPMAVDPANPKSGECVQLLGASEVIKHIQEKPEEFAQGSIADAALSGAIATNACGLSLALGQSFYLQKSVLKGEILTSKDALLFARKLLTYLGENNLVPALYSSEHPVYALKPLEAVQGKTPEQLSSLDKIVVGQAVLPCSEFKKSIWDLFGNASQNNLRKVFFRAMAEADRKTAQRLRQSKFFSEFASAVQKGNLHMAAGIYNPIFAYEFNRNVEASAAQGWGGFGAQKFFDEIRLINKDLSTL